MYDLKHGTTQRVNLVRAEGQPETDDVDVTNAYDNAGLVRRFLTTVFERNSIDNRALDLVLNVHFSTSYNNAFWDGDEMTFGDGDNPIFGKDPQPAHYADRYTGTADNGGVHLNSGIPNRAFYLASVDLGDTLIAARIWYHALQFLPVTVTFAQAAHQVATSARVLVTAGRAPKGAAQIVRGAWRSVGVA